MAQLRQQERANFLPQGGSVTIDVPGEVARLRREPTWTAGDRHGASLVKGDGLNVALMMLKRGARLKEHHTKAPITVQVVEGRINFFAQDHSHALAPGQLFALDRGVAHWVEALEDSVIILTVGGETA